MRDGGAGGYGIGAEIRSVGVDSVCGVCDAGGGGGRSYGVIAFDIVVDVLGVAGIRRTSTARTAGNAKGAALTERARHPTRVCT